MLYPDIDIESIGNPGEKVVAEALLEQCPPQWRIIYSKFWLWRDARYNENRYREGEIDFVVIVPGKGMVCIEVKSAKEYRRTSQGVWERFDEAEGRWIAYRKSPWEQAVANKHALVDILRRRLGRNRLGCGYCAAVVFPRCRQQGQLPAGEDDPTLVIDANGLESLSDTLKKSLDGWWEGSGDTSELEAAMLPDESIFCESLAVDVGRRNQKLLKLTGQQARILSGLRDNKAVQILGGAGTGKTVLAMELARRAVTQGQRVLFLCFSRKLASWVSDSAGLRSFLACNFHRLAYQYAKSAKLQWPESPGQEFWSTDVSTLLLEAVDLLGPDARFDTVIVDEAQDFLGEWLIPVRELWNETGQFILFGDENQTVFGGEIIGHREIAQYVLQDNCRNTREIAYACSRVLRDANVAVDLESMADLPRGEVPRWVNGGDLGHRRTATVSQIEQWLGAGLKKSQIAVLSPWADGNCLGIEASDTVVDGMPFTRNLDVWREGSACLFETIRGFKGLEADAVIVTDVPAADEAPGFTLQDAYVGFSRAKQELVAIASSNEAGRQLASWFSPESQ
jgi:ATP:corrinoid adenosyltransferase